MFNIGDRVRRSSSIRVSTIDGDVFIDEDMDQHGTVSKITNAVYALHVKWDGDRQYSLEMPETLELI